MNKILNTLLYPIKFLLRKKVLRRKQWLEDLRIHRVENAHLIAIKARRMGFSKMVHDNLEWEIYTELKYQRFVDFWEIK